MQTTHHPLDPRIEFMDKIWFLIWSRVQITKETLCDFICE